MKDTMSARNISKFHKFLREDVKLEKISKALGVSKKTLEKFTPEKIKAAKNKHAEKSKAPSK